MQKFTKQQQIIYLQSLSDRSPEEEVVLEKLLSSIKKTSNNPTPALEYRKQSIERYYQKKAIKNKF